MLSQPKSEKSKYTETNEHTIEQKQQQQKRCAYLNDCWLSEQFFPVPLANVFWLVRFTIRTEKCIQMQRFAFHRNGIGWVRDNKSLPVLFLFLHGVKWCLQHRLTKNYLENRFRYLPLEQQFLSFRWKYKQKSQINYINLLRSLTVQILTSAARLTANHGRHWNRNIKKNIILCVFSPLFWICSFVSREFMIPLLSNNRQQIIQRFSIGFMARNKNAAAIF